jgi:putative transposase
MAAVRYVERNPVRAGLVSQAWDWPWSSAAFHVELLDEDPLVTQRAYFGPVHDWRALLSSEPEESERLRYHVRTGRPLGSRGFIETAERLLGRRLRPRPAGRPSKDEK